MSLVTTPMRSSSASCAHTSMTRELLPVPTGPQTPSLRARDDGCAVVSGVVGSGTEQPPASGGVHLGEVLEPGGTGGGDLVRAGESGKLEGERRHLRQGGDHPPDGGHGVQGAQLEGGRG